MLTPGNIFFICKWQRSQPSSKNASGDNQFVVTSWYGSPMANMPNVTMCNAKRWPERCKVHHHWTPSEACRRVVMVWVWFSLFGWTPSNLEKKLNLLWAVDDTTQFVKVPTHNKFYQKEPEAHGPPHAAADSLTFNPESPRFKALPRAFTGRSLSLPHSAFLHRQVQEKYLFFPIVVFFLVFS